MIHIVGLSSRAGYFEQEWKVESRRNTHLTSLDLLTKNITKSKIITKHDPKEIFLLLKLFPLFLSGFFLNKFKLTDGTSETECNIVFLS